MKVGSAIPERCLPPLPPRAPHHVRVPAGAWDTHTHVIGAPENFPWVTPRNYDPPAASAAANIAHLDTLGMAYGVLVQVSVHGTDNRVLCNALAAYPERLRGVAVVAPDIADSALAALDDAGVCGVRVVTLVAGGVGVDAIAPLAERIAPFGWHMQIATDGKTLAAIAPMLRGLRVPVVLDHFGGCDPADGIAGDGFLALLRLIANGAYVKLSAAYRLSAAPWHAMTPLAQALMKAAPERVLWASDWPHVAITNPALMPPTNATLDLLTHWTTDETMQRRILVDNPARLYDLPGPTSKVPASALAAG